MISKIDSQTEQIKSIGQKKQAQVNKEIHNGLSEINDQEEKLELPVNKIETIQVVQKEEQIGLDRTIGCAKIESQTEITNEIVRGNEDDKENVLGESKPEEMLKECV